ncbi:MAG: MBL fold metallo-hydrolase [Anaerolineaceae bacterium]
MNRLTILGSSFAVANKAQENSHLLLQSDVHTVLIDCGNNPVGKLQMIGVSINDVTELILTHAHADHMGALPLLLMDMWLCKRQTPLIVYGLPFTLEKAKTLLDVFDWRNWHGMYPVEFRMVSDETIEKVISCEDIEVSVAPVKHLIPTIGVRSVFPKTNKVFVYSSDSEPCENLDILANGADLFIQESAGPGKGHSSPEEAGSTAARASVKELVLIHFDAKRPKDELIAAAEKIFKGKVLLAKDLMFFE